jgi:hypothetical protein
MGKALFSNTFNGSGFGGRVLEIRFLAHPTRSRTGATLV